MFGIAAGLLAAELVGFGSMCSAPQPPTPESLVSQAEVIAVVEAPTTYRVTPAEASDSRSRGYVDFRVVRTLKGESARRIGMPALLTDEDNFNRGTVPYTDIRPGGEAGCVATAFRRGASYLFLMQREEGALTPYWVAIAPTHEQLQPRFRTDPWFRWVRSPVRRTEAVLAAEARAAVRIQHDEWEAADIAMTRLAPSEFPELPAAVIRQLEARGCSVPQGSWPASMGRNVVSGEFIEAGQKAWAVLCSVERVSAILVFDSADSLVAELHRAPDLNYLQGQGDGTIVASRMVTRASPAYIRDHHATYWEEGDEALPQLTHDGVEDGWDGKASSVLYFTGGEWLVLQGAD